MLQTEKRIEESLTFVTGIVCYVGGKPKGVMTQRQFDNLKTRNWWDETKTIKVPSNKWENLHIGNVERFVNEYSVNPEW